METQKTKIIAAWFVLLFLTVCANAQTSAFSYQGRLVESGNTVTGSRLFRFTLYDENGVAIPGAMIEQSLAVASSVFNTSLDFGAANFPGANRSLEIAVKINVGDPYTVLNPRQPIASSPYSIRTLSSAQADISLDSNRLGGVAANEYVTTSTAGSSFVRNSMVQQTTANFNIDGDGTLGGTLQANAVRAQTITGTIGLTQTDGTINIGTYIGGSSSGATGGWFGTFSNSALHFFSNNSQPQMTILPNGNVGIGTANPQAQLQLAGNAAQDRVSHGFVKAMLNVAADGAIVRCYNGITGSSAGFCGFTVTPGLGGSYTVNLGFQVTDRFISVAALGINGPIGFPPTPMSADYRFSTLPGSNPNEIMIDTFRSDSGAAANNPFMLIVF